MAQKNQAAAGTELKQPEQHNRVFRGDLHPPDCMVHEQHNLAGWNRKKKKKKSPVKVQASLESRTNFESPPPCLQQGHVTIHLVFLKAQLAAW